MQDFLAGIISQRLQLSSKSVNNTVQLLGGGATIPFISRYRKEMTGSLDEVQVADIQKELNKLTELQKRKESILKSIEEQGKLTDALQKKIKDTFDSTILEDIYLPYKKKRKTRATTAKEKGLEPLANLIFDQKNQNIELQIEKFLNSDVANKEEALQGARDIIAEWINEDEQARKKVRYAFEKGAVIKSKVARGKEEAGAKYSDYFDFEEKLSKCPSHRLLAIRRGEEEGFLRVSISPDEEEVLYQLDNVFLEGKGEATEQVAQAIEDCYKRLLGPSIETEFRNLAKNLADQEAIEVFKENLRQLLLAAPLGQKRILALDPGFRSGCKVVVLNESGDLLHNSTIFPHPPQNQTRKALSDIENYIREFKIEAIAIGNGTAGRETLSFIQDAPFSKGLEVFMVNENGASIYSASEIARNEFPDKDLTVRGAVSIGRRLMDPLAELVKIDPKSIGVGQYQHDVNQGSLKESLTQVVESCVNSVGINVNTASKHLLTYVSGLGPTLAQNIVEYRSDNGAFSSRSQLKKVPRMGGKAFEQCAGFLRIQEAKNPLDNTAVHPERYKLVKQMADDLNCKVVDLIKDQGLRNQINLKQYITEDIGLPTLKDIKEELGKPGLDPRGSVQAFQFSNKVKTMGDLEAGMRLPGIVTNITNFGAFVDIGVKQDGLVHISQLANKFVKSPADVVKLGQQVDVKVVEIDETRNRIQLSMKD